MASEIHPLQEATVHLLDALYKDKHLPVTKGMLSIQNGYYPDLESILSTLHRYANEDLVSAFTKRNHDLIEQAKNDIEEERSKKKEEANSEGGESEDDPFGFRFAFVKPYELMKSTALADIEQTFSEELSKLCGEELEVSIESLMSRNESFDSSAEMKVTVKAKRKFR